VRCSTELGSVSYYMDLIVSVQRAMKVPKSLTVALNALIDIANHSMGGRLVSVPDISKRLNVSISRVEELIRQLRNYGLVVAIKGRTGGYRLSRDPSFITIKDIVLAVNQVKKRKIEVSDMAKDLYQSLETYMMNYISTVSVASAIKNCIPKFSEVKEAPERKSLLSPGGDFAAMPDRRPKGEVQRVVKTAFKKVDQVPRGPNSIFNFSQFLNQDHQAN
jgi:Rrf2 family transcriptional regulator, iron-sulfur cluster assembly transcription factor